MRVAAATEPGTGRAVWYHDDASAIAIGVWMERLQGRGEDAEPLLAHHRPTCTGVAGVFDGSGGSGAATAYESPAGRRHSGAWTGARVARAATESWFHATVTGQAPDEPEALHEHLTRLLAAVPARRPTRLLGSIRRELPTTMAALRYRFDRGRVGCRVLWAGDSRVYVLTHRAGLQVLTRDHTVETDTLAQLLADPPMTNVICADRPFHIDHRDADFPLPCVLVCATDGFFSYVDTPAHFECRLLGALQDARDTAEWADLLCDAVADHSADDATLSVVALGYRGFANLRDAFADRTNEVMNAYWQRRPTDGDPGFREWRSRTWQQYQPHYQRLMPAHPGEAM